MTTATTTPTTPTTVSTPQTLIPATLVNPNVIYFTQSWEGPSGIYAYDYETGRLGKLVEFPRQTACFDFDPRQREKIYYVEANSRDVRLFVLGSGDQGVIFSHSTWVRCVRVGLDGSLYFSEATGAGGDGQIYRIAGERAELFYEVKLTQVHGFWAGHFDFDERGTLYLSNGNIIPANLYLVENRVPRRLAALDNSVVGIRYVEQITVRAEGTIINVANGLMFADHSSSLYLYDLNSGRTYKIYENTSFNWLSDVGLR